MANPFQPDRVDDATIRRNFDRLQTLLARYEKAVGGFRAYRNAAQSRTTGQIVNFDTEVYDYSGWLDVTTNVGRFTPLIAGIYRFSWRVSVNGATELAADNYFRANLFKNGAINAYGQIAYQRGTAASVGSVGSVNVEANGSTDYFEISVDHNKGSAAALDPQSTTTWFCGEYVGGKP
jgi:hypothetical protein